MTRAHFRPLSGAGAVLRMECVLWVAGLSEDGGRGLTEADQHMVPASFMCGQSSSGSPGVTMGRATKKALSLGRNQIQKDETMAQGTLLPLVEPPPEQFIHSICLQNWPCVSVRLQGYTHHWHCTPQPLTVCIGAQFSHEASLQLVRTTWAASENWGRPHHLNHLSLFHPCTGMLGSYHPSVLYPVNPSLPDPQPLRPTGMVRLHVQTALGICSLRFPSANTSKHSIK